MSAGSYSTSTFTKDIHDEIKRLGTQVELFWQEEQRIYDDIQLPENARIMEIGSGPGFYVKKLAGRFPDATFVSFEYDKYFTDHQKVLFDGSIKSRIEIVNGDINDAADLGQFDLVVSRMVLEHMSEPESVFVKMSSFVKVGGQLVLLDNDFSNHLRTYPRVDELDDLYNAYCRMRLDQGGNPYIGRELPRYFSLAGYKDINFSTITAHTFKIDKSLFLGAESSAIGMTLVEKGYLNNATFKNLIINWSKMAHASANIMMRELYYASGVKTFEAVKLNLSDESTQSVKAVRQVKRTLINVADEFIAPQTSREKQIADVWCEFLNAEAVGINLSFFELGGESYLVPLIVDSLRDKYQIDIEITDIFEHSSIEKLAAFIDADSKRDHLEGAANAANKQRESVVGSKGKNPFARLKKH